MVSDTDMSDKGADGTDDKDRALEIPRGGSTFPRVITVGVPAAMVRNGLDPKPEVKSRDDMSTEYGPAAGIAASQVPLGTLCALTVPRRRRMGAGADAVTVEWACLVPVSPSAFTPAVIDPGRPISCLLDVAEPRGGPDPRAGWSGGI
ncbi:hypothetical protein EH165_07485 [Nakamurella antarctica]|uniref:Uncharacterized protein n=1 Tax=Nakamurella antarctica TaxID=1902245 RepID=A0A3G8ZVG3_9ACTN|nr:hypothetical protein [Nakamurella antarctica]AZI58006.1 hypothetical protein EH165_07485 [Nakamurella antarctica]